MDPLSPLLAALISGAAAALQSTASEAVKDGYAALKRILASRYKNIDLDPVERDPAAPEGRRAVEQQLRKSDAGNDAELLSRAEKLLEEVARNEPSLASIVGIDLEGIRLKNRNVRIEDIISAGSGVRVKNVVVDGDGDFVISKVRAGVGGPTPGKR